MNGEMKYDFIIIGQGIAGSTLAWSLLQSGKKIMVVDDPSGSGASKVAAGIFNPVVLKRLTTSWRAGELLSFAGSFYRELGSVLKIDCYHPCPILKIITTESEKAYWEAKAMEPELSPFIHPKVLSQPDSIPLHASEGFGKVLQAGFVNIRKLLDAFAGYLQERGSLTKAALDYRDIRLGKQEVSWQNIKASRLIFCEGYQAVKNPWFGYLPFKLAKGETLTIRVEGLDLKNIVRKRIFIMPLGKELYKVGSTYEWDDLTEHPSPQGKAELEEKLRKIIRIPFQIVDHQAGIRPTVTDRRPLIGIHPEIKELGIFNGMGTKGIMLAPFFASQFTAFLNGQRNSLDREIDIKRYSALMAT